MVFMAAQSKTKPPVKEGEVLNAAVVSFGKTGDPIVKVQKYTIFVKDMKTKPKLQQVIPLRVIKVLPNFGFAEEIEGADDDE